MHIPVLFNEVIRVMEPKEGEVFVDGTFGGGGHAQGLLKLLGSSGKLIGIDADEEAIRKGKDLFSGRENVKLVQGNYAEIAAILESEGIERIDGLLLDLGFSSFQIDSETRGFSFKFPAAPLDMRYGPRSERAEEILNAWDEKSLMYIFRKFGEERYAGRIARKIIAERKKNPIRTVGDLLNIVERTVPFKKGRGARIHPATRIFQALRIAANDELGNLESALSALPSIMNPGGRVAIISFHSLEDREVKTHFRGLAAAGRATVVTKKPIVPGPEEIGENPRSRSAKLRAVVFS